MKVNHRKDAVIITGGTAVAPYAFNSCGNITSITLSENTTSIGAYAFQNCTSLTEVNLTNNEGWWYSTNANATSGTAVPETYLSTGANFAFYLTRYISYYLKCI